jgi:hypothetical protein
VPLNTNIIFLEKKEKKMSLGNVCHYHYCSETKKTTKCLQNISLNDCKYMRISSESNLDFRWVNCEGFKNLKIKNIFQYRTYLTIIFMISSKRNNS